MTGIALTPFLAGWIALACAVVGLAIYRRMISHREDQLLHVSDAESAHIARQAATAHQLDMVDRWGKLLTVVVMLYGLALAAAYFYRYWIESSQQMWK